MKPTKVVVSFLTAGIILAVASLAATPARSQPNQFIIENADDSATFFMVDSLGLGALISNVPPRFVVANANQNVFLEMVPAPAALMNLIGQVSERFVLRNANENRFYQLGYPMELIGDKKSPQVSQVVARTIGDSIIRITWTTDEFTRSELQFGTQSGIYPQVVEDTLYRTLHEVTLNNISSGVTYYYRITNTDRSGNSIQSGEYSFRTTIPVYLPLLVRLVRQ